MIKIIILNSKNETYHVKYDMFNSYTRREEFVHPFESLMRTNLIISITGLDQVVGLGSREHRLLPSINKTWLSASSRWLSIILAHPKTK